MNREQVQELALNALIENNGGTIVLSPGTGKSKVAIDFIKYKKAKKVLITSPRTNLKQSWEDELEKWKILHHSDDAYNYRHNHMTKSINITLENIQTCYKWSNDKISEYDLIIMDEIHTMATEEYGKLAIKVKRLNITTIGLTGTPDDKKYDKFAFYARYCPIVYRYEDSSKHGIINKRNYIIYEHELDNSFEVEVKTKNKSWKTGEKKQYDYIESKIKEGENLIRKCFDVDEDDYIDYFSHAKSWYWNGNGNTEQKKAGGTYMRAISARKDLLWSLNSTNAIASIIAEYILDNTNDKILIFSERTDQTSRISKYTVHSKNNAETNKQNLYAFDNGFVRQLGSCYSLTLGLNLIGTKYAIMESYNSSDVQFKQRSGRVDRLPVDENAIVIFIVVKNTQCEKWFNEAVKFDINDKVITVNNMEDLVNALNTLNNE